MKIYHFGAEDAPVLLLLPGTCCHWKSNFGAVIPLLADSFRVLCVSYDGFDETEQTEFPTMLEETEKIEAYLKTHCGGRIRAAYGCSLGGSFVGLLAARQNIHMDCGILGSSDLDQASPLAARLQTDFLLPLIYPVVRDGKFKAKFLQKRLDCHQAGRGFPARPHGQGKETLHFCLACLCAGAISGAGLYAKGAGPCLCRGRPAGCASDSGNRCQVQMRQICASGHGAYRSAGHRRIWKAV